MAERPLDPDEAALWARVLASVRPLAGKRQPTLVTAVPAAPKTKPQQAVTPSPLKTPPTAKAPDRAAAPGVTLDASWDRRLARGVVAPDSVVDLHGHNLQNAYTRLDLALDQAITTGDRVVLLVTGKPPRPESERPHARGAIRDAIGDWLSGSRHARAIAAVRAAHPRHGGAGALYIVLRKPRTPQT
ncbi:DNA mismatch repair protein MutS [Sphingomonas koreensis]|nr:DNA mismatch repair protein MutS [Sphingomonas koreensis]